MSTETQVEIEMFHVFFPCYDGSSKLYCHFNETDITPFLYQLVELIFFDYVNLKESQESDCDTFRTMGEKKWFRIGLAHSIDFSSVEMQ